MHKHTIIGQSSGLLQRVTTLAESADKGCVPILPKKMYRRTFTDLESNLFTQLQDIWAVKDRVFDGLKDRWARQTRGRNARGQGGTVAMRDWVPTGQSLTPQEELMKTMDPRIMVHILVFIFHSYS